MIDDKDSMQLSEYCFNVCTVLKTAVQGRNVDSLGEPVRAALEDLERCVSLSFSACSLQPGNSRVTHEIERTLRRGANMPRTRRNKGKVEGQKLKIQEIHNTLNAPGASLDGTLSLSELVSADSATTSVSGSGMFSASPSSISYGVLITPAFSTLVFQLVDVWSDARSLWTNSPP